MENQKNLILAVVFSIIVLLTFDLFFPKQQIDPQVQTEKVANNQDINQEDLEPSIEGKIQTKANDNIKIKENRVTFNMKRLTGSINLYGATLDDVVLKDHKKSIKDNSENIKILTKENSISPYLIRLGWASSKKMELPNKNTLWSSDKKHYENGEDIILSWKNTNGVVFQRIIQVDENFIFKVKDTVENNSSESINLTNFAYIQRRNYRPENKFFILHEGPLGVFNDTLKEVSYDELEEQGTISETSTNGWIGITDHYWQVAIFPETNKRFKARFKNIKREQNAIQVDYINDDVLEILPNKTVSSLSFFFVGAKEVKVIDSYIKKLNINKFDLSIDFGWFYFLTKPLFYVLNYLSILFGNFGIGIIILTIILRIILFPLANKSFKSMNSMRLLTPEIQRIRERFKDDRTKMNQEMFALYKNKKINPAAGCLPILVQIPIFFALYKVLFVSIEMRHAPFFGWIKDLSAPDPTSIFNFFGMIPWDPPSFLNIGIWPILMGLTMYLQQKINPPPPDPIQAKIFLMLPFVFTFLLATFPSGMVIYWTINNILSIGQQSFLLNKQKKSKI
ncbi:membrane protein insertase YidC [Rickettsiales bacterium]|nr:membrane protein insertase YidC [Rickettsiales bacterium]